MVLLQGAVGLRNITLGYLGPNSLDCICFQLFSLALVDCLQGLLSILQKVVDYCLVKFGLLWVLNLVRIKGQGDDASAV